MNKFFKLASIGMLAISLAGCSCSNNEQDLSTELTASYDVYSGNKVSESFTTQDIYEYIRENETDEVNKVFVKFMMEKLLDFENNPTRVTTYNLKVKKYFEDNYLNSDEYKVNGVFNEDLLASSLTEKLYIVNKNDTPTSGPTYELGLKYDYQDYINNALNYDIYMEILKEEYILNNRETLLNNSKTRIISIYSNDSIDDMEEIVEKIYNGEFTSLDELNNAKKEADKKEIGRQYCLNLGFQNEYYLDDEGNLVTSCSATTSSSTYDSALNKFTTCANGVRCEPLEGLAYQIDLIEKEAKIEEKVVNKDTTDILYEGALNQLFRSDVGNYLSAKVIENADPFLINGLYNYDESFGHTDIILSSGPNSTCYLVTVRVVDSSSTSVEDKEKAFDLLLSKVSEASVLTHYADKLSVEVKDSLVKEFYSNLTGK